MSNTDFAEEVGQKAGKMFIREYPNANTTDSDEYYGYESETWVKILLQFPRKQGIPMTADGFCIFLKEIAYSAVRLDDVSTEFHKAAKFIWDHQEVVPYNNI